MKPKGWEERFVALASRNKWAFYQDGLDFIASELQKQKESIVEMIKAEMLNYDGEASDALFFLKDDIIKKIGGLRGK